MLLHGLEPIIYRESLKAADLYATATHRLIYRVGKLGSPQGEWERATWPYLAELAKNHPDAGIHFQGGIHPPCAAMANGEDRVIPLQS